MSNQNLSSGYGNLVVRLIRSRKLTLVWLRRFLIVCVCVAGLIGLYFGAGSLKVPYVYMKDFIQEYLLARAVRAGVDPYLPISELAQRFIGHLPVPVFPHPTPHPPPVAILMFPLSFLSYQQAAVIWFIFEVFCVFGAIYLLSMWSGFHVNIWMLLPVTLSMFAWHPFWEELVVGQLMTLILVLLLLSWRALQEDRSLLSGILLGMLVSLKLIGWPIVMFLALHRKFKALGATFLTIIIVNAIAGLVIGYDEVWYYYAEIGRLVSTLYRGDVFNFSLWSVGWRLFEGAGSNVTSGVTASPIVYSPNLARWVAPSIPLLFLMAGLLLANRVRNFDIAYAIMVCISLLVNPVAWTHYLILATLPLYIIVYYLFYNHFSRAETHAAFLCGLLLLIPRWQLRDLVVWLRGVDNDPILNLAMLNSFTLFPAGLILFMIWLLWRLDQLTIQRFPELGTEQMVI
jgi:hypothetical protein